MTALCGDRGLLYAVCCVLLVVSCVLLVVC